MTVHGRHGHTPSMTAPGAAAEAERQRPWMVLAAAALTVALRHASRGTASAA